MRDEAFIALLDDIESDRVERKESVADGDKIRQAICAFANDLPDHKQPGVFFIGVNDADHDAPADIQPLRDVDVKELDQTMFKEFYLPAAVSPEILAENSRTTEEHMASLRLIDPGPPSVPTVLGVLILSKKPSWCLPGAYVSFLRLAGEQLGSDVISSHDIQGPLPRIMSQIDELLKLHIMTSVDITSGDKERRVPDYPLAALQQIVRNAIMHRSYEGTNAPVRIYWYSDRIEVISPGGPYGHVTKENFGRAGINDYRNPNLAEAMRHLGYAQHFGVGIQIARETLARNGNPPIEFKFDLGPIMAIIRKKNEAQEKSDLRI
jgi:ATP-dependent DNA helicase RecG